MTIAGGSLRTRPSTVQLSGVCSMAWHCLSPLFCTRAVLVGLHDGRVDQNIFIVRILRKHFKDALLSFRSASAGVAQMHHAKVAKAPGQISPRDTCAVAVQHRLDKLPVDPGRHAHMVLTPRHQVLDAFPLIVSQCIFPGHCFEIRRSAQHSRINRLSN